MTCHYLRRSGLRCQVPQYCADRYDPEEVEHYLNANRPLAQRVAAWIGAHIFIDDETVSES